MKVRIQHIQKVQFCGIITLIKILMLDKIGQICSCNCNNNIILRPSQCTFRRRDDERCHAISVFHFNAGPPENKFRLLIQSLLWRKNNIYVFVRSTEFRHMKFVSDN